jgi:hypothetical protein
MLCLITPAFTSPQDLNEMLQNSEAVLGKFYCTSAFFSSKVVCLDDIVAVFLLRQICSPQGIGMYIRFLSV